MKFGLRFWFGRIYRIDEHLVPQRKPILLAVNHPNTFMEAIVMGTLLKRPIHFLARSDAFTSGFITWLLGLMNALPIYRQQEGVENLAKNEGIFSRCYEILAKGGAVLIFPEGLSIMEKRLRPLKKGAARLAFGAEEGRQWQLELQVVPVGFTYSAPFRPFSELITAFGPPIPVLDFREEYERHPAKAINRFNERLSAEMRKLIVEVRQPEYDLLAEHLLEIFQNEQPAQQNISDKERLHQEQALAGWINQLPPGQQQEWHEKAEDYFTGLKNAKLDDAQLSDTKYSPALELLLGWPLFLLAAFYAQLPFLVAEQITLSKVKELEFKAPVQLALSVLLYLPWLLTIVIAAFFVSWYLGVAAILCALSGFYFPRYIQLFNVQMKYDRYVNFLKKDAKTVNKLKEQRMELIKVIEKAMQAN